LYTISELARTRDWGRNLAKYTEGDFSSKIENLRRYFGRLNLSARQEFVENLQKSPPEELKNYPKYKKFVNECIRGYNYAVKNHNSKVNIDDLRTYFQELNFPNKLEFIQKLQTNVPKIKNQSRYRIL